MKIPRHIALIPDGNRRWAKERGLRPWDGHSAGIDKFEEFTDWCYDIGVEEITAYSTSRENLQKRTSAEVQFLFKLYEGRLLKLLESPKLAQREARVEFAGDLSLFPRAVTKLIEEIQETTKKFKKRKVTLCFNYSGRDEILRASRAVSESKTPWTEKNLEAFLQIKSAPDILIRTAEHRISNFLLWQLAYSEIYFSPKMFPDFTKEDLMDAIGQYNKTDRRYGK